MVTVRDLSCSPFLMFLPKKSITLLVESLLRMIRRQVIECTLPALLPPTK